MANPIPDHVPPERRALLVVGLDELPESVREFAKVRVVHARHLSTETVSRIDGTTVHFKGSPPFRGNEGRQPAPRPIDQVWVDVHSQDGRSLLVAALLPLLTANHRKARHYAWKRQDTPGTRAPAWVAVGALHDQWIGPPGAGDVDHQVPGLIADMGLTEALLHVWAWAQGRQG